MPILKVRSLDALRKDFIITKYRILFLCLIAVLSWQEASAEPVKRHIHALYNSNRGQSTRMNHIHSNAEMVLNHLGCLVDYWDIAMGLPSDEFMLKYRGVLTWFYENSMANPEQYLEWASRQIAADRKFVIFGSIGATVDLNTGQAVSDEIVNRFCERLGFRVDNTLSTEDPLDIELVFKDSLMVEFERSLDYEIFYYTKITLTQPEQNSTYLKLRNVNKPNSESAIVFTTPSGGYAVTSYVIYQNEHTNRRLWRINPFKFFNEAFQLEKTPRPDVNTLNGMRIWCTHIDGDALISLSEVKPNSYCGEIVRDEIIKKYAWPISVSVVVAEVEKAIKFDDIARSIFRIDWVEAASHSYAHPFYWADDYWDKGNYPTRHLSIPGYTFDLEKEIVGSVQYINEKLLPPGKKVKTFFWTGNCEPQEEALALCERIGVYNTNGGDAQFDKSQPSYTSVTPLGVTVGDQWQVYSPNTNENVYTNDWTGPYYAFKYVLDTFENTESPIRVKPINIYYHFYSGEKWAALNALREVVETTIVQDVAPMYMSEYIEVVHGFRSAEIEVIDPRTWLIKNYGTCTTMRFDDTALVPDLHRSSNVLGFHNYQGSLYVHLEMGKAAVIALTDSRPEAVYLEQGSHRLVAWSPSRQKTAFRTKGFGEANFVLANLERNAEYSVTIRESNGRSKDQIALVLESDADGRLLISHAIRGEMEVLLKLRQSGTN